MQTIITFRVGYARGLRDSIATIRGIPMPGAELVIIEDSGHTGSPTFNTEVWKGVERVLERAGL